VPSYEIVVQLCWVNWIWCMEWICWL